MTLTIINFDASPSHHIFKLAPTQFAVIFIRLDAVENIAVVQNVSKTFVDKRLNHFDNIFHRLGNFGINICVANVERVHTLEIRRDIFLGNFLPRDALLISGFDNLVVNVGEILHVTDFVATFLEETTNYIPRHERAGIADMRRIVRRHATTINTNLALLKRLENFLRAAHRVENFNHKQSLLLLL